MATNDEKFLDTQELINTMIISCNDAVGAIMQGQYVLFCRLQYEMVQKLGALKRGVAAELKNRDDTIAKLCDQLRTAGLQVENVPIKTLEGADTP